MAKGTSKYLAGIKQGDHYEEYEVDLLNPPRDMYSPENPMIILGSVVLPNGKKAPLPDFTGITILGGFDCSTFMLNSDSVLPRSIIALDCSYSIGDLGVLIGILPNTVVRVFVRGAILNNIKNDKDDARHYATEFKKMHPNVTVTDGKRTLDGIFAEIDKDKEVVAESVVDTPMEKEGVSVPEKTDDWLEQEELVSECKKVSERLKCVSDADLVRFVKMARSGLARSGIKTALMKRSDDVSVMCVNRADVQTIVARVLELIDEKRARLDKKNALEKTKSEKESVKPVQDSERSSGKFYVDNQEVVPVEIKKYIPTRLWGQLRSACGDNKVMLLGFLNDINAINVNPASTQGKKLAYIQDGELKFSNTIHLKSAQCLAQSFCKTNNRARIVWSVCGNVFLCADFFPEHEKTKRAYQKSLHSSPVDLSKINLSDVSEYKNVADLIAELSIINNNNKPDKKETKAKKKVENTVNKPVVTDVTKKTVADKVVGTKEVGPVMVAEQVGPEKTAQEVCPLWQDLYSMKSQFEVLLVGINNMQQILITQLSVETDTDKMLTATQELQDVLARRKTYEDAIKKISDVKRQLTDLHQLLEKTK